VHLVNPGLPDSLFKIGLERAAPTHSEKLIFGSTIGLLFETFYALFFNSQIM
jgi:hypothetical protein